MKKHRNYPSQPNFFTQILSSEHLEREQQFENEREEIVRDLPFTD